MVRKYTNKLLEMVENGLLDKDTVIMACVKYMSEDDVKDMMRHNDFIEQDEDACPECGSDNITNEGPESEYTCHDCSHQWSE